MRSRVPAAGLVMGAVCALIIGCTAEPAPAAPPPPPPMNPAPGASGAGDPYCPMDGNGGYDATEYQVGITYDPAKGRLDGDTTVIAKATQDLDRYNLDLRGLTVQSVEVDGKPAKFAREGEFELVVTPAEPIRNGTPFRTKVVYGGDPSATPKAGGSENGWQKSKDGGAFIVGEPHSASFWYPVNETPRDKAMFTLTARVPDGWTVISNGREIQKTSANGWTTTSWQERTPVASYLTTVAIDKFTVDRMALPDGTPVVNAYAPGAEDRRDTGRRLPEIIGFLSSKFGPYPVDAAGGIYLDEDIHFSLETQTRPTYAKWADLITVVHETAHQWFGDSVTLKSWSDICLNECLASYAQWLWQESRDNENLDDRYRAALEIMRGSQDFWAPKLVDMGAGKEFHGVYDKGILAIHALRRKIGEGAFGRLLKEWPAAYRNANASWADFEAFTVKLSDQNLRPFFDAWFHGTTIPPDAELLPGTLRG
ncbi:M1 family metallopeptidase [Amycolatopsis sp. NPDC057786]|uniref:M1 family metallopeptidase n=1 Tax=Amycolatopsis sp. NPDC057786 TaxID=3346250 RepID=UPI003670DEFB